jgi:ribosome-associated protein
MGGGDPLILLEDTGQQKGKHQIKNYFWSEFGIKVVRQALPVGDYVLVNDKIQDVFSRKEKRGIPVKKMDLIGTYDVAVDSKNSILELVSDICGKDHDRFRDECVLAMNNGITLYIVVENEDGINDVRDLHRWVNPRLFIWRGGRQLYPNSTKGITLMKACLTMQKRYNVKFLFCPPRQSGGLIIELLNGGGE